MTYYSTKRCYIMKKSISSILCILCLAGCSAPRFNALALSSDETIDHPAVIHVLGNSSESEFSSGLYDLSEYEPLNSNTIIQIHPFNSESLLFKLRTDFAIGEAADIFAVWPGMLIQTLKERQLLMNLSPYLTSDPAWLANFRYPGLWEPVSKKGQIYGLPVEAITEQVIINGLVFERFGIPYPRTLYELTEACKAFRSQGIVPLDITSWPDLSYLYQGLVCSFGGPQTMTGPERPAGANPYVQALYAVKRIYDAGGFSLDDMVRSDTLKTGQRLIEGKAAMMFNGSWSLSSIHKALGPHLILRPFPITENRTGASIILGLGSTTFYVSEKPKRTKAQTEEIIHLLKHFTSPKTVTNAFANSYFLSNVPLIGSKELSDIFPALLTSGYRTVTPPDHGFDRTVWQEKLLYKIPKVLEGEKSPEEIWAELSGRGGME